MTSSPVVDDERLPALAPIDDPRAAIRELIELRDPGAILKASGYGMQADQATNPPSIVNDAPLTYPASFPTR